MHGQRETGKKPRAATTPLSHAGGRAPPSRQPPPRFDRSPGGGGRSARPVHAHTRQYTRCAHSISRTRRTWIYICRRIREKFNIFVFNFFFRRAHSIRSVVSSDFRALLFGRYYYYYFFFYRRVSECGVRSGATNAQYRILVNNIYYYYTCAGVVSGGELFRTLDAPIALVCEKPT